MNGEMSVNELVVASGGLQANVSKQMGILADGGLVTRRKAGVSTLYRIADPTLFSLCDLVCRSLHDRGAETLQLLKRQPPDGE
jgi:DNA-binding transcriptional ArsR family regulator